MLSEDQFQFQRRIHGMTDDDDDHKRTMAAIEAAARKCGIRSKPAVDAVVGAIMGGKLIKVEADGSIAWTGEDGWDLPSALPAFLKRSEHRWLKERDRELAAEPAKDAVPSKADLRKHVEAGIAAIFDPPPMSDASLQAIGRALVDNI